MMAIGNKTRLASTPPSSSPTMSSVQQLPLPPLSNEKKKLVAKKRPFHVLDSFFEVRGQPQQKQGDVYKSILAAFLSRVESDPDLSSLAKQRIALGNKGIPFTGERLWDKAKEIKRAFAKDYLPHYPKATPGGTTKDDELLDMCLKNFHFAKAKEKLAKEGSDPGLLDFAQFTSGKTPVDFWAFRQLHAHLKLSPVTCSTVDPPPDPEEGVWNDPEAGFWEERKRRQEQIALDRKKKRKEKLKAAKALEAFQQLEFEEKMKLARRQMEINKRNMQLDLAILNLKHQELKLKAVSFGMKAGIPGADVRLKKAIALSMNAGITALQNVISAPVDGITALQNVISAPVDEVEIDRFSSDDSTVSCLEEEESPNTSHSKEYHHHLGSSTTSIKSKKSTTAYESSSDGEEHDDTEDKAKGDGSCPPSIVI